MLQQIEVGLNKASLDALKELANYFGTTVQQLVPIFSQRAADGAVASITTGFILSGIGLVVSTILLITMRENGQWKSDDGKTAATLSIVATGFIILICILVLPQEFVTLHNPTAYGIQDILKMVLAK